MKTTRILSLVLTLILALSFAACGAPAAPAAPAAAPAAPAAAAEPAAAPAPAAPAAAAPAADPAPAAAAGDPFADGPEVEIIVAYAASEETSMGKKQVEIAERLAAETNGKIKMSIYPNGQLGSDTELFEGVQAGNISMTLSAPSSQVNYIPELAILDIGGLYKDLESCNAFLKGDYFDEISSYYEKANIKLLSIDVSFFREMTSNKPINSFADFQGVKIRTQENKYHMAYWSALGANPTPLAFAELYIGLQQGLVDAQENPIEVMKASKLNEVQDYLVLTHHIPFVQIVAMNLDFYNSLPAAYQDALNKHIRQGNDELIAASAATVQGVVDELVAEGTTVLELDDATYQQMQVGADACIAEMKKDLDPAVVDAYVNAVRAMY